MEEGAQYEYFCERGLKNGFHLPLAVNVEKYDDLLGKDVAIEIPYKQIFGDIIYKKLAELEMKFCQFVENVHR